MFIVLQDEIVVYALADKPYFNNVGLVTPSFIDISLDKERCMIVEYNDIMPINITGGKYKFTNGEFVRNPDYIPNDIEQGIVITPSEFRSRFTQDELELIYNSKDEDVEFLKHAYIATALNEIRLNDFNLIRYMNILVTKEILTADRAAAILAIIPVES